ncbi:hypothetical protein F4782DRAFT_50235 [Xylaria castorea]|nr:hypothetical protein F4782DRAFT_50235 [Xylaria castorea]
MSISRRRFQRPDWRASNKSRPLKASPLPTYKTERLQGQQSSGTMANKRPVAMESGKVYGESGDSGDPICLVVSGIGLLAANVLSGASCMAEEAAYRWPLKLRLAILGGCMICIWTLLVRQLGILSIQHMTYTLRAGRCSRKLHVCLHASDA